MMTLAQLQALAQKHGAKLDEATLAFLEELLAQYGGENARVLIALERFREELTQRLALERELYEATLTRRLQVEREQYEKVLAERFALERQVIEKQFAALREQIEERFRVERERTDQEFAALRELMMARFAAVDERFRQMERRFQMLLWFISGGFTLLGVLMTVYEFIR